ncbi:interferon alpha/beta receptor 2-like [Zootoca vivipara]|uniref:interferon alpha/beta receptor 2-like n=1 Tax=Zootoca vivipara TaxID=8524 RepID=UPI00293BE67E|nr:interferon alpha/beta receptor 2-like [Zootoca vivipara]XP_060129579.1 interferon alpha/beta receptor 2-like [Zootoca vivipara]
MMTFFMGQLHFYKLVYVSALISALCSLLETSVQLKLKMEPRDFEYILTWEAGNNTGTPTHYNVMYRAISYPILNMKIVTECSNITRSFCNLTKEFTDPRESYKIVVDQVTESGVHSSAIQFSPYPDTCLTSPQFEISACPRCANVTVKLSSSLLQVYQELDYTVTVIRDNVKEKRVVNTTRQESFHTVIGDLSFNKNYCIAVDVKTSLNHQCTPSVPKCIMLSSSNISGHIIFPALFGILMPLVVVLALFVLYKTGVICLRWRKWPSVLSITPKLDYSLFKTEPEEVHTVQVTQGSKKKVCGYNFDEEDSESIAGNDDLYAARVFLGQTSKDNAEPPSFDCSSATSKIADPQDDETENLLLIGCSSATSEMPEPVDAEADNLQNDISKEECPTFQLFHPSPEVDSTNEPDLECSSCSNINLDTVVLGISGENRDISATLSPFEEDAADSKELCVSDAFKPKHFPDALEMQNSDIHNLSCSWQNSNGSGESESSDSETDCVGEYMSR